ncbi:MAG TPA: GNAT family N-acetyltransferase [Candidatus Acidoferrum sp.]|nr:GNAT family N-acetyltransferase [Candidatus Acidoferrum sp.]
MIAIRAATADDAAQILGFIRELAEYERAAEQVVATVEQIRVSLTGPEAKARALIGEIDGVAAGFAVYFYSYSTWLGRNGIYLEDVYASPMQRGKGLGKALLQHLATQAVAEGCGRLEWSVLDWNTPAIEFYDALDAEPLDEWIRYRLSGESLRRVATGKDLQR